jgi:hypothetical protein
MNVRHVRLRVCAAAASAVFAVISGSRPAAAAPETRVISLVEEISTTPARRPALRQDLESVQLRRLERWRARGILKSYRLLFNRFADAGSWDALEVLTFADPAAAARWAHIERTAPAGLDPRALRLATALSSAPSDLARSSGTDADERAGPFLVIPYETLVSVPEYERYFDGYTLPQLRGWSEEGVLGGFELHLARYYAGRPWSAMLILRYRGDEALDRREAVVAKVRGALAADPAWKAFSDDKKAIRTEKQLAVADELGAAGRVK